MRYGFSSSLPAAAAFALICAGVAVAAPTPTETVVLQLNWKHQFQFAGKKVMLTRALYGQGAGAQPGRDL